ncbi:MAG: hypothetical protein V1674_04205 [Candidatus Omnitrophota bacterium]
MKGKELLSPKGYMKFIKSIKHNRRICYLIISASFLWLNLSFADVTDDILKECNRNAPRPQWETGEESVPKYLKFKEKLKIFTDYLNCKCEDWNCSGCRISSTGFYHLFYYNDRFLMRHPQGTYMPEHVTDEYVITKDGNIEKLPISFTQEGYYYIFSVKEIDLMDISEGKIKTIVDEKTKNKVEIKKITSTVSGSQRDRNSMLSGISFLGADNESYDVKLSGNELKVYIFRKGVKLYAYGLWDYMKNLYFNEREKVLTELPLKQKRENQIYDHYIRSEEIKPDDRVSIIYDVMKRYRDFGRHEGLFVYNNQFLIGESGGEVYAIRKESFDGKDLGKFCEDTWAIGGGGNTNPDCKIPQGAIRIDDYLDLVGKTCKQ